MRAHHHITSEALNRVTSYMYPEFSIFQPHTLGLYAHLIPSCQVAWQLGLSFNPLNPKSDKLQISPYSTSITTGYIQVMRVKGVIIKDRMS